MASLSPPPPESSSDLAEHFADSPGTLLERFPRDTFGSLKIPAKVNKDVLAEFLG